jgi:hypothetical protein
MGKMIIAAQEHFTTDNKHEINFLLIGMRDESYLLRLALMEASEIGPFVHIGVFEDGQVELEHVLREFDSLRLNFEIDSLEQLADELLANLGKEIVAMSPIMLECRNKSAAECFTLPKSQANFGINKGPLKSSFNNHSRQVVKAVRRKK